MQPSPPVDGIRWNLVNKNLTPGATVINKMTQKISKLHRYLVHFPQDTLHLQIVLEKNLRKDFFTATMTLKVPSNTLHCEKSASNLITAIDLAAKAMVREVQTLKTQLSGDFQWKQSSHRPKLRAERDAMFSSVAETEPVAY
jgi:ribosomal subunit interface protein